MEEGWDGRDEEISAAASASASAASGKKLSKLEAKFSHDDPNEDRVAVEADDDLEYKGTLDL
jgi:hypothetical protein